MSKQFFFFPCLFSSYFRSVGLRVVSIVSGGCNQSSSAHFYVVFESLYRCINAIFNASKSSSPFFFDTYSLSTTSLWCKALCMVFSFLVLWSICWSSSLVQFKNGPKCLTRRTAQVFILFIRFLPYSLVSSSFLILQRYSFLISFFHLHLFDCICFQYSYVFVSFLFPEHVSFPAFHY